jgi:hypothetical protein
MTGTFDVIGEILADMASGKASRFNLDFLRLSRLSQP